MFLCATDTMRTRSGFAVTNIIIPITTMNTAEAQMENHPKLLIIPKNASSDTRICTIAHPRTLVPCRYLFCPNQGVYEFTRINAPSSSARSCLISAENRFSDHTSNLDRHSAVTSGHQGQNESGSESTFGKNPLMFNGYVAKTAEYFIATPLDPLFLMLPALVSELPSTDTASQRQFFLSIDDLSDKIVEKSVHFNSIINNSQHRQNLEARIAAVSDIVDAGDEKMYRLSLDKLLTELLSKAQSVVCSGLPASIEEKFVQKVLEAPIMGIKRQESFFLENASLSHSEEQAAEGTPAEIPESQSSSSTGATLQSECTADTEVTVIESDSPLVDSDGLVNLLRLRIALSYIMSSYLPSPLTALLDRTLASLDSPVNFKPLEDHLTKLTAMRAQALASRSVSDYSRKRGMDEDDDVTEARVEKKRKKEEEEKRKKAGESRGVRDLKKADISGMKKLSSFFTKAPKTNK